MIIITTPKYEKPVNALAQWQKQKGYDVLITSQNEWDKEQVRSTVKTFWDENDSPEYMLIVGDYEDVPTDSLDLHHHTFTDVSYVLMDGEEDYFTDMAHGRISVQTEEEAWTGSRGSFSEGIGMPNGKQGPGGLGAGRFW